MLLGVLCAVDLRSISLAATSFGRSKWLSLLSGSRLQPYCNQEGINLLGTVRIGIVGNNENDCGTPDTFLGVGSDNECSLGTYSGNSGCLLPVSPDSHNLPADVSILIK